MRKCRDGSIEPFSLGARFKDGSIRVDIPLQSLNLCRSIVSVLVFSDESVVYNGKFTFALNEYF